MKRIISGILIIFLALALTACTASVPTPAASPAPTEQAEGPTPEPTEELPEPTENIPEPTVETVTGLKDFYALVEPNSAVTLDLDFDGLADTVSFFTSEKNEYDEYESTITIKEGTGAESEFKIDRSYETRLIVLDCDDIDSRLEIVACWVQDSDDWSARGFRISETGSGVTTYEGSFGFMLPEDYNFNSEQGFRVFTRADALGTYDFDVYYTLTADGFKSTDDLYLYPIYDNNYEPNLLLERELEVELLDGEPYDFVPTGETYTIPVGTTIYPFCTDLATYVIVRFDDWRFGMAELTPATGEGEWGYYINGVDQDEYGQIPYAD